LYTRQGCCLCDQARDVLRRHGLEPEEVNIDADDELRARFTDCVPVVEIDGKVRFRGRVSEVLLRRLLAARGDST
jgi:glutaredoxin